jgi:hypothetical protein
VGHQTTEGIKTAAETELWEEDGNDITEVPGSTLSPRSQSCSKELVTNSLAQRREPEKVPTKQKIGTVARGGAHLINWVRRNRWREREIRRNLGRWI